MNIDSKNEHDQQQSPQTLEKLHQQRSNDSDDSVLVANSPHQEVKLTGSETPIDTESWEPMLLCPVCGKLVKNLYTAISYGKTSSPAHFDCIVRLLREREDLPAGENWCYLGGGSFGVVRRANNVRNPKRSSKSVFSIRNRIDFESEGSKPEWRTELRLVSQRTKQIGAALMDSVKAFS